MIYEIIMTVICLILFSVPLGTDLRKLEKARNLMYVPLFAIGLLWLNGLVFRIPGRTGALSVIIHIIFYILLAVSLFTFVFMILVLMIDKPKKIGPIIGGNPNGNKHILILFHTGFTGKTQPAMEKFAAYFKDSDYQVHIQSMHRSLPINLENVDLLIINSPVYMGTIRAIPKQVLQSLNLNGMKTAVMLTGGSAETQDKEIEEFENLVTSREGKVVARTKILTYDQEEGVQPIDEQIALFAEKVKTVL